MTKLCNKCKQELVRLPCKLADGTIKDMYLHPKNPAKKCEYEEDGTKISIEIIDQFLLTKFQELVEESVEEIPPKKGLEAAKEETKAIKAESNEDKIKRRLSDGDLTIDEYDKILERLNK